MQSQTRAKNLAQCCGTGHLCCALLSSPALGRTLLWGRAWHDSWEPVGVGCWAPQQKSPLGTRAVSQHRVTRAALHPSHGARLSTRVPAGRAHHPQFSASRPPNQASRMPACAKCSHCYPCFFIMPVSLTLGRVEVTVFRNHLNIVLITVHTHNGLQSSVRSWWKEMTVKCSRKHLIIQMDTD